MSQRLQVVGVDPPTAQEKADLAGARAATGGVKDPELLPLAQAASGWAGYAWFLQR
jgi:hypothetical protein